MTGAALTLLTVVPSAAWCVLLVVSVYRRWVRVTDCLVVTALVAFSVPAALALAGVLPEWMPRK